MDYLLFPKSLRAVDFGKYWRQHQSKILFFSSGQFFDAFNYPKDQSKCYIESPKGDIFADDKSIAGRSRRASESESDPSLRCKTSPGQLLQRINCDDGCFALVGRWKTENSTTANKLNLSFQFSIQSVFHATPSSARFISFHKDKPFLYSYLLDWLKPRSDKKSKTFQI